MRRLLLIAILLHLGCVPTASPAGPSDGGGNNDVPDMPANNTPNNTSNNPNNLPDMRSNNLDGDVGPPDMGDPANRPRFSSIAMADRAVCVLETSTKKTFCWGSNVRGLLKEDVAEVVQIAPFERLDFPRFESLSAGRTHMCGVANEDVLCWGDNRSRQSATNPNAAVIAPETVITNVDIDIVSAGKYQTCARVSGGGVTCWGSNVSGTIQASVMTPDCPDFGSGDPCIDPSDNSERCINLKCYDSFPPTRTIDASVVRQVAAGDDHDCVLTVDDEIQCWGRNDDRRAVPDLEGTAIVTSPTAASPERFDKVSARTRTCGVVTDGSVICWGPGEAPHNPLPNIDAAIDVVVGDDHACALVDTGAVWCWGDWTSGPAPSPAEFVAPTGDPFLSVGAGVRASCASTATDVYCWGDNSGDGLVGQFEGDSPISQTYPDPIDVPFGP